MQPNETSETTVKGVTYRVRRMPPMQQLHVSRRLAPVLAGLAGLLGARNRGEGPAGMLGAAGPFGEALARLPDADVEYIMTTCLATVSRSSNAGKDWSALYVNGQSVSDDLGLDTTLPLVMFVVKQSLGPFIADFLTSPPGEGVGDAA